MGDFAQVSARNQLMNAKILWSSRSATELWGIATCWFKRPQLLRILMPVSKEVPIKHLRFVKHL